MLTITLLGTAATMPLPDRALTAAVAECGGHSLLFDCGEGTQTAARRAGVNLMKMDAVCLTHYHGDHIFGLPGLLQTLGCQGRTRPLALYGPKGLGEVWAALRVLTGPLPYPVYAEVLDAPAALCEKFGGWPQGIGRTGKAVEDAPARREHHAGRWTCHPAGSRPWPGPAGAELCLLGRHRPLSGAGKGRSGC